MIDLLIQGVFPLLVLLVCGGAGWYVERRDERRLTAREAAVSTVVVTDLKRPIGGGARDARLVVAHVVVGAHYGKQLLARVRNLIGGEVRSFESVLDRARRTALVDLREQAAAAGASSVVNVRFVTSMLGGRSVSAEVICSGTALTP